MKLQLIKSMALQQPMQMLWFWLECLKVSRFLHEGLLNSVRSMA